MIATFRWPPVWSRVSAFLGRSLSGYNPNSRVSDDTAALSGYIPKAPGFAGGYLLYEEVL